MEFLHCGVRDFRLFCSCDLDLDPMTFIYELDPYSMVMYRAVNTCSVGVESFTGSGGLYRGPKEPTTSERLTITRPQRTSLFFSFFLFFFLSFNLSFFRSFIHSLLFY